MPIASRNSNRPANRPSVIPLWLKLAYTVMLAIVVPVYWAKYGPVNFLWFSDIALIGCAIALWIESPLLASMMAVGVLFPEIAWNVDFFLSLPFGQSLLGVSSYMFDPVKPLWLRGLSLFHVPLPPVLIYLVVRLGYDRRAAWYQTALATVVLVVCRLWTEPARNINWVFGLGEGGQFPLGGPAHFWIILVAIPCLFIWPTHLLLNRLFGPKA